MESRPNSVSEDLQKAAFELGFPLFGITSASESPGFAKFCQWLDQGYAGSMEYLTKRRAAYQHPSNVLANAKTLVMLGMPYSPAISRRRNRRPVSDHLPIALAANHEACPNDANDDSNDNLFVNPEIGRFPNVEEDKPAVIHKLKFAASHAADDAMAISARPIGNKPGRTKPVMFDLEIGAPLRRGLAHCQAGASFFTTSMYRSRALE